MLLHCKRLYCGVRVRFWVYLCQSRVGIGTISPAVVLYHSWFVSAFTGQRSRQGWCGRQAVALAVPPPLPWCNPREGQEAQVVWHQCCSRNPQNEIEVNELLLRIQLYLFPQGLLTLESRQYSILLEIKTKMPQQPQVAWGIVFIANFKKTSILPCRLQC